MLTRLRNFVLSRLYRDWSDYGDAKLGTWRMRRWRNGQWEYRDCTEEELGDAVWQQVGP